MKIKYIILWLIISVSNLSNGQTIEKLTFESTEKKLLDFIISKGDVPLNDIENFKSGKYGLYFFGVYNNLKKGDLINGIYCFSLARTHSKNYFLIVENNNYIILDITSKKGLELAIENTLNFCEREKYCSDLISENVTRLINTYYKINLNPNNRIDVNCERNIIKIKKLP